MYSRRVTGSTPMQLMADVGMLQAVEDIRVARHDPEALARRRVDLRHGLAGRPHARIERVPVRADLRSHSSAASNVRASAPLLPTVAAATTVSRAPA